MNRRGFFGTLAAIAGAAKAAPALPKVAPFINPNDVRSTGFLTRLEENTRNPDIAAIEWLRERCRRAERVSVDELTEHLTGTSVVLHWYESTRSLIVWKFALKFRNGSVRDDFKLTSCGPDHFYVLAHDISFGIG